MNITIISAARSGSNWLLKCLETDYTINLKEIFNRGLAGKNKIKEKDLEYLYPDITQKNNVLKNISYKNINYHTIKNIQDRILHNKKHCLYKVLYEHYLYNPIIINKALDTSDCIIGSYRENILESYISSMKSVKTNIWWTDPNKKNLIDKNNLKIEWNLENYLQFYDTRVRGIQWIKSCALNSKYVIFTYEEIHSDTKNNQEKIHYVQQKIFNKTQYALKYNHNYDTFLQKENIVLNISDHFSNPNTFDKDFANIPTHY